MKVYDSACQSAAELKIELQLRAQADGVITPDEAQLLDLAERTYAYSEATATSIRIGTRMIGGGHLDDRMARQVRESVGLLAAVAVPQGRQSRDRNQLAPGAVSETTKLVGRG